MQLRNSIERDIHSELSRLVRQYPWVIDVFKYQYQRQLEIQLAGNEVHYIKAQDIKKQIDRDRYVMVLYSNEHQYFNYLKYVLSIEEAHRSEVVRYIRSLEFSENPIERNIFHKFTQQVISQVFVNKSESVKTLNNFLKNDFLDINYIEFDLKRSLLHQAASSLDNSVADFVLNHPDFKKINQINRHGETALHLAIQTNMQSIAERILNHPEFLEVNRANFAGQTVLHYAVSLGSVEITQMILQKSQFTAFNQADNNNISPLELARIEKQKIITLLILKKQAELKMRSFWK